MECTLEVRYTLHVSVIVVRRKRSQLVRAPFCTERLQVGTRPGLHRSRQCTSNARISRER